MKITIETYGVKYSVEADDELEFFEFMEHINSLAKTMWSQELVDKYWE